MSQIRHGNWILLNKNLLSSFLESRPNTDGYSSFTRYILLCWLSSVLGAFLTGTKFWNHNLSSMCKVGIVDLGVSLVPDTGIDDSIVKRCSRHCIRWNSSSRWKPCRMCLMKNHLGRRSFIFQMRCCQSKQNCCQSPSTVTIIYIRHDRVCLEIFVKRDDI